jgi:NADH-quinone oxidoreductase subunit E
MALSQAFHDRAQELMSRYPRKRSALLMVLHEAQDEAGYISADVIREVAAVMGLTTADVAGVATFYSMFKMRPQGRFLLSLCTNVSCAIWGADGTAERLKELIGPPSEPTADGLVSWEPVECLAFCSWAPAAQLNSHDVAQLTPERAEELIAALRVGTPFDEVVRRFREAGAIGEHSDA